MTEFLPRRTGRRGPRRSRFYVNECIVLEIGRLKAYLKSHSPMTLLEFPGVKSSIDVCVFTISCNELAAAQGKTCALRFFINGLRQSTHRFAPGKAGEQYLSLSELNPASLTHLRPTQPIADANAQGSPLRPVSAGETRRSRPTFPARGRA